MTHKKYLRSLIDHVEKQVHENAKRYSRYMRDCECLSENKDGSFTLFSKMTGKTTMRDEAIYRAGQNHMAQFMLEHVVHEWRAEEEKAHILEQKKRKKNGHD